MITAKRIGGRSRHNQTSLASKEFSAKSNSGRLLPIAIKVALVHNTVTASHNTHGFGRRPPVFTGGVCRQSFGAMDGN
jgi:hypothetical protein